MKTKALYILVSDNKDFYLEQAYLSIYSLKLHNPNMCVVVLMDNITSEGLVDKRFKILNVIDDKIVVELNPNWQSLKKSRYLKTAARTYIKGDFLFIDTDTIIVSSLEEIDYCEYELAAVKDNHTTIDKLHGDMTMALSKKLSITIKEDISCFNSGVFYVKDNESTHSFYKQWNELWLRSVELGVLQDQPSLNLLNHRLKRIGEIAGVWNCQLLKNGLKFFTEAKIVHYYNTFTRLKDDFYGDVYFFTNKKLFCKIKSSMTIDNEVHNKLLNYTTCFPDLIEFVSGNNLDLIHSRQYRILAYLYIYCNPIYHFFEFLLYKISLSMRMLMFNLKRLLL